jgi:N-acetylneuraminate lyase
MYEFQEIVALGNAERQHGWTVFSGMDEQCLFACMFGSHGNIGSTLNFMPQIYAAIREKCRAGDYDAACELQLQANEATRTAISFGFMGALYEILSMQGFDCGAPRLPNLPLSSEERQRLRKAVKAFDFVQTL